MTHQCINRFSNKRSLSFFFFFKKNRNTRIYKKTSHSAIIKESRHEWSPSGHCVLFTGNRRGRGGLGRVLSPVPCWHFSMMTRKSLPSWPQCWAPCMTVETVTMFQQSHQAKVLKVTEAKEPRMEGTAEPRVLGAESAGPSRIASLDFPRNDFLRRGEGAPPSPGTTLL